MLSRPLYGLFACGAALVLTVAGDARAQGDGDAVRRPERLTTGVSDQLLGQLSADGHQLYFISNRNTTSEIYRQDKQGSGSKLLFDEGADVTWPRLSPDGKRLLYISFRDDASGQLCVRDLPDRKRRCLGDGASAVQAQWIDGAHIALVARASLAGDLRLMLVTVKSRLTARERFARNLVGPTVSPDGRWLVYVPVQRYVEHVGPGFAASAQRLEAVRLDQAAATPQPLVPDLPGLTGQPAFSLDGSQLFFTQFLDDSNQDGEIDAADHGVLFAVPFDSARDDAPARAAAAPPRQLTDAQWNCQYASPATRDLVTTCARGDGLDVFGLPLDGVVPGDWSDERLRLEVDLSARTSEQQLLYRHLLVRETAATARRQLMMRLVRLHLDANEFEAADFYAKKIKAQPDPETAGAATALRLLIEERRALRNRERGRSADQFVESSRSRFALLAVDKTKAPAAISLRRVVRSEIADRLGDKEGARRELEAAPVEEVRLPSFLEAYYDRADALYRELDDSAALAALGRRLAQHPALGPDEQLRYARAAVRALVRGQPFDAAAAILAHERAGVPADSELGFALELGSALLGIRGEEVPKPVRAQLVALYKRQTRHGRRRAVVLDTIQRAVQVEAEKLIEAMAQLYVDDVPRGTGERRRAERLFDRVMLGRAYRRLAAGKLPQAREAFQKVAATTGSLEGHVGYIDVRLREGATPDQLRAEYAAHKSADAEPVARFVQAYLTARELPLLDGRQRRDQRDEAIDRAAADLKAANAVLRGQAPIHTVWGAVLHERYLSDGTLEAAQRANLHYLLALELVARNPRYKALVLTQLGILQAEVGNQRIALGYLQDRDKLGVSDDAIGLTQRLVEARTLFHVDREADAAHTADAAVAMVERTPALAEYRALALDRAALYNLAIGQFARALALYDQELPLLATQPGAEGERNRVVTRLGRAGAALGADQAARALTDLDAVEAALRDRHLQPRLRWPHATATASQRSYGLIASGLRANAHLHLGQLAEAARALEQRRMLAEARFHDTGLDDHLRALTLVEARLADLARDRGDVDGAGRWLKLALGHADTFVRKTGVAEHNDQLDLLRLAAELRLDHGLKLQLGLGKRLRTAHDNLARQHDPRFRGQERWLEIYLALFGAKGQERAALDSDGG